MTYATGTVDCLGGMQATGCGHPLEAHTGPGGCAWCRCVVRYSTEEVRTLRRNTGLTPTFDPADHGPDDR